MKPGVARVLRPAVAESAAAKLGADEISIPNQRFGFALRPEQDVAFLPRAPLIPFAAAAATPWAIPFSFDDYLELVDWLNRASVPGKRGQIAARHPRILDRLSIDAEQFIAYAERAVMVFGSAVGAHRP